MVLSKETFAKVKKAINDGTLKIKIREYPDPEVELWNWYQGGGSFEELLEVISKCYERKSKVR